ncbi:MAG: uridine kinase [Pseudoflavonifractor capillosus]|uniref:Uridine kinase n=1 Tax=Pseudoflavonifractor capillosus ATCC 29799 TaxID=411467 RepID=A6NS60_9FIRM|nr:uridine kinase [Pseudoflavonifractor capillosus]EDN01098.1 uridine kinase [Pseudoflavonifractor capillosus ATCC 29799]MCI5927705.1 uridine kinase [Pseudoflavonifractor capillosus]MDY4662314.1 uridine kinase [Pseudoflavonifractor capillosus]
MNTMVIGIAGGTGSGKTTLTRHLVESFGGNISVVYHDNYYKAHPNMTYEERAALNYDHPDAFDTDLMVEDLRTLCAGKTIHCPVYDYTIHNRSNDTVEVKPTKVVIVEGILIFENKALRDLMDIKIFVDTDADVRILRRILRDVKERGRSLDSVIDQYLTTVKPMHEQFVQPSRQYADIVVLDGGHNLVALEMITQRIKSHVEEA